MTINPGAVVDEATFSVTRRIWIAAPVETVWEAVTRPERISEWFGRADLRVGETNADVVVAGATGTITWPDRAPVPIRVVEVDEPRSVAYRWVNPSLDEPIPSSVDEEHSTVFTFTLEGADGGTALTVVETGFQTMSRPTEHLESHRQGWDGELDKLVAAAQRRSAASRVSP